MGQTAIKTIKEEETPAIERREKFKSKLGVPVKASTNILSNNKIYKSRRKRSKKKALKIFEKKKRKTHQDKEKVLKNINSDKKITGRKEQYELKVGGEGGGGGGGGMMMLVVFRVGAAIGRADKGGIIKQQQSENNLCGKM